MLRKGIGCQGCPLYGDGYGFSAITGTGSSGVMVVAEASGTWERKEGRPLVEWAPSGQLFQRVLDERRIDRDSLSITNILRCQPPGNFLRGAPYEREAIDHCNSYLRAAIRDCAPRVLLALGDTALRELHDGPPPGTVTSLRGFILPSRYDIPLVATYHPAYLVPRRSRDGEAGSPGAMHLFGVLTRDIMLAVQIAQHGVPTLKETNYELTPTVADVERFYRWLVDRPTVALAYDIETAHIIGEPEPADWGAKRIIQIQFSAADGHAIVLPWRGEYKNYARLILSLPNPKWGWNSRLSDDLALEADGCVINGEWHDLMLAHQHLNPSFTSAKEDKDTDKGVPSRLMGLQSCTSFYAPEMGPWKHLSADPAQIPFYGAVDADTTRRCGVGLMAALDRAGLMEGYWSHKLDLRPVLDGLGARGLPVDAARQSELRTYVQGELARLVEAATAVLPPELVRYHPPAGYKSTGSIKALIADGPDGSPASRGVSLLTKTHKGQLVQVMFNNEQRWAIRLPFNPSGSSGDTLRYIRHMNYRVPTQIDDPNKPTTGKIELARLADETGDTILQLVGEHRELRKTGMDYTGGKWLPGPDGRVHATFKWGTASGQLTATDPPVQTYPEHSGIAKRAKAAVRAQPGHKLVKIDYRGAHARLAGWLANDPLWYRLASFDVHSFVTAHFLHLPVAPLLATMDDEDLSATLALIKREHHHVRNYQVKRIVHGVTFGAKARKIYRMYSKELGTQQVAQELIDLLGRLFPRTFKAFPAWVAKQVHEVSRCRLVSPYGHHRMFYDFDMEQAIAYLPSNGFHCYGQAALVRLHRTGALDRYEAVNWTHDAVWLHPTTQLVERCIEEVGTEMARPSEVLVGSPLGPFWCATDAEVGGSLAEMKG